ncbi:MAG: flagellar protein FliS [Alphaproteobacteria bacterium]|nr:MAG: flagellar protein FliS [Alphaproteobacteria bacterium]TAF14751.1 MAG: flagellar protein FliS [Alphaproteobacteria bacterium]TAF40676.1 MAG: flagellar protein FliS [Alphaproteobacteria bacterium]TAF76093.1 MAG: flagellar protein FliS [Alphaproteobacteria bacterium]
MNHYHQVSAYKNATQTVHKTRQIVMLYDGLIRFLQQAKQASSERNVAERYTLLVKATQIVNGLQSSLDYSQSNDISNVLYQYYELLDVRIFRLHGHPKDEDFNALIEDVRTMRDVWYKIDKQYQPSDQSEAIMTDSPAVPMHGYEDMDLRSMISNLGLSV